ncbi:MULTISPECIES: DUF6417 family protein [unclassified Streptomyces]|uniref:DUF6417 family protein n=1 Tax=unclassified Streptomyces TaxID=2593676 RepID=UPI003639879A
MRRSDGFSLAPMVVGTGMNSEVTSLISEHTSARRMELLTLEEAHDLLRPFQLMAAEGQDELSEEAQWFAPEIAERIPSEN